MLLVVDNGASVVKAGYGGTLRPKVKVANCIAQSKKNSQLLSIGGDNIHTLHAGGYIVHRPVKAGILVELDKQMPIWNLVFDKLNLKPDSLRDCSLALTEAYGTPPSVHSELEECLFEHYGFQSALFLQSEVMSHYAFPENITDLPLIPISSEIQDYNEYLVDYDPIRRQASTNGVSYRISLSGKMPEMPPTRLCCNLSYNGISAFPMLKDAVIDYAIYKNYTGGRHLDTQFKRMICLRRGKFESYDLALAKLRESSCILSPDLKVDLAKAASILRHPQALQADEGVVQTLNVLDWLSNPTKVSTTLPSQLVIGPERYAIYESLFTPEFGIGDPIYSANDVEAAMNIVSETWTRAPPNPSNVEVKATKKPQGLVELIVHSIFSAPPIIQSDLCKSIILAGGLLRIKGLKQRLLKTLRSELPTAWSILTMALAENVDETTWLGTAAWADANFADSAVTKHDYFEGRKGRLTNR